MTTEHVIIGSYNVRDGYGYCVDHRSIDSGRMYKSHMYRVDAHVPDGVYPFTFKCGECGRLVQGNLV